ncbi:MAG: DsbE family thiol:disulfide interchange protein [Candidatus Dactylopiibacterium carminicum]|uniref:DsbE family thiol:disulfide interchange protein n=1 Tax=Candidatus Dactylopiibacterium carminicum TaxID=857335 RepID=A0A272EXH7_9RHOO|nr:DsbE family thiol:disulfide interchange protein [Candidatus Dactylopiibacterium carminicum]KAF7600180.1 DsbE family thiol:disulfide interchange protein [Candidatus Dactylopiibacterium carminicum]PAS94801.1 MAG: DsbE family thiol:disulfide interchange protein [Candidatus Dactylopiibacterium carminicum]PAS97725.1 MAG: DsbE family thiol:disulfide interchange protein [Candidatus Dactylopiibacterium carminicum]PAT00181.1 MAG: thiol:disulfide interchange protein [Candidatus Dactylopiibacterium car
MKLKSFLPLALFLGFAVLLGIGLTLKPRELPSPLIDKPAPQFSLPRLQQDGALALADMRGQVWLLNVWASWCVGCREEHPALLRLAQRKLLPIVGLNYKDERADALRWLKEHDDPYTVSVVDADGRVGIDYGVYGVPETFIIDAAGRIRYKHIGPLTDESVERELLPRIRALQGG